jgi:hypothetical protein
LEQAVTSQVSRHKASRARALAGNTLIGPSFLS